MSARDAGRDADRGGYFWNGVDRMRTQLQKELRLDMARYARLEGMQHPCLADHGRIIDLRRQMLEMLPRRSERR